MKMITFSKLRKLALATLCACGISANAQITGSLEQYINGSYENVAVEFKMSDVAYAFDSDTTSVRTALDSLMTNGASDICTFYLVTPDGSRSTNYTQGSNGGFWVGLDGNPMSWGAGCVWFNYLSYATGTDSEGNEADEFDIVFGQYPGGISTDTIIKPKFVLAINGKEVTFDITYTVKSVPAVQEPATLLRAQLNIVGEQTTKTVRTTDAGYSATAISIPAADIIEKLGLDKSIIKGQLTQLLYTDWLNTTDNTLKDSVTNTSTANAPGWWYQRSVYGAEAGEELQGTNSPVLGAATYGNSCHMFLEFGYDEENEAITCNLGQYPGTPVAGDSVSANVYVINGDKVYKLTYIATFEAPEAQGLADMTKVGESTVNLTIYDEDSDYSTKTFESGLTDIAAALGCETSAVNWTVLQDADNLYSGSYTANNGYYVDESGFVCSWGENAAVFVEQETANDNSQLHAGLYMGLQKNVGKTYTAPIYFTNGSNYYILNVVIAVEHKELAIGQNDWTIVNKYAAPLQFVVQAEAYTGDHTAYTLTDDQLTSDLGTSTFAMYCDLADTLVTETNLYGKYSTYPCGQNGAEGIWYNETGKGCGWNGTQYIGICRDLTSGAFTLYQMPGARSVGDSWSGNMYFVDEETGKMVQVAFTVSFVDELKSSTNVGTESIVIPVKAGEETFVDIDMSKPAAALKTTIDELLNGYYAKGMTASGTYGTGVQIGTSYLYFDNNGNNADGGAISFNIAASDNGYQIIAYSSADEVAEDFKSTGKFAFEMNDSIYEYNVTFCSEAVYTGVNNVNATVNAKDGKVYDLSGRIVARPVKGLYIKNGKKFIVK